MWPIAVKACRMLALRNLSLATSRNPCRHKDLESSVIPQLRRWTLKLSSQVTAVSVEMTKTRNINIKVEVCSRHKLYVENKHKRSLARSQTFTCSDEEWTCCCQHWKRNIELCQPNMRKSLKSRALNLEESLWYSAPSQNTTLFKKVWVSVKVLIS